MRIVIAESGAAEDFYEHELDGLHAPAWSPSLHALFVGHVGDLIAETRTFERPWGKVEQMRSTDVEKMQRTLTDRGLYQDKIDGKAGMKTRSALGAYQKANGLPLDCWPTATVLKHMLGSR